MFGGVSSVRNYLYLDNNLISILPDDVFSQVSLTNLSLTYNKLTAYPGKALQTQNLVAM